MTTLLEQFLSEAHELLQNIDENILRLERSPSDDASIAELFRVVHTLKGNSGLFNSAEMTGVLHASEDLMEAVRSRRVPYSRLLADRLLEAMDFVRLLCAELSADGKVSPGHAAAAERLGSALRGAIPPVETSPVSVPEAPPPPAPSVPPVRDIPLAHRMEAHRRAAAGETLHLLSYVPAPECFYNGDDCFLRARRTPGVLWAAVAAERAWPPLAELDAYRCVLRFTILAAASREALENHYRDHQGRVSFAAVEPSALVDDQAGGGHEPAAASLASLDAGDDTKHVALASVVQDQRYILSLPDDVPWLAGRLQSVARTLHACLRASGHEDQASEVLAALKSALGRYSSGPLLEWLDRALASGFFAAAAAVRPAPPGESDEAGAAAGRPDEPAGVTSLKVDPAKVDLLMNLIGEMVVAKNALPYLAEQAELRYGQRELSLEIKEAYEGINRIAEEMHDAIMQVRMMPCSVVFRRFVRLVRDTANRLGKKVTLVLEGEETEADRNIIESLVDPLMHLVRNSLDHGVEAPVERLAAGKRAEGTLVIRARQESDRAVIEIIDDGRGIDPDVIRRKAVEKALVDPALRDRMTDAEALDLLFLPGFSTADVVSSLSGRGVGLDVVRTAIERMHGTVTLESRAGAGTTVRLSLPRTMAATSVIIVEAGGQSFGVPMESVVETVRVPRSAILTIKKEQVTTLRGRVVPLRAINDALGLGSSPRANGQDEVAVLVLHVGNEDAGLVVDDFRHTADIILKPMSGVLAGLPAYAGSTLMGDGSVLMVLNPKELF